MLILLHEKEISLSRDHSPKEGHKSASDENTNFNEIDFQETFKTDENFLKKRIALKDSTDDFGLNRYEALETLNDLETLDTRAETKQENKPKKNPKKAKKKPSKSKKKPPKKGNQLPPGKVKNMS